MKIITDTKTLKFIHIETGLVFDKKYKYCVSSVKDISKAEHAESPYTNGLNHLKHLGYSLKYFDGCFHPFLVKE